MVTTPELKPMAREVVVKINQEEVVILLKTSLTLAAKESQPLKTPREEESKEMTNQKPILQKQLPRKLELIFKVTVYDHNR